MLRASCLMTKILCSMMRWFGTKQEGKAIIRWHRSLAENTGRPNKGIETNKTLVHKSKLSHIYLKYPLSWLTWALCTITPVLGLANSTFFSFTILLITSGSDHLGNNLAVIFQALELTRFFLYITVSPTLNWWGLRPPLNLYATLQQADFKFWQARAQSDWPAVDLTSTSKGKSQWEPRRDLISLPRNNKSGVVCVLSCRAVLNAKAKYGRSSSQVLCTWWWKIFNADLRFLLTHSASEP